MARTREDYVKFSVSVSICVFVPLVSHILVVCAQKPLRYQGEFAIAQAVLCVLTLTFLLLAHLKRGLVCLEKEKLPLLPSESSRYCRKCNIVKPERAHHCRRCKRCIKCMDHHCPWIGACVNYDNLAYFIRFMVVGSIAAIMHGAYLSYVGLRLMNLGEHARRRPYFLMLITTTLSVFFLSMAGISFSYVNIRNVLKSVTFVESLMIDDLVLYGVECKRSPYDMGWYTNLTTVLGKPYFLFLLGEKRTDGLTFDKTYEVGRWPPSKISRWQALDVDI